MSASGAPRGAGGAAAETIGIPAGGTRGARRRVRRAPHSVGGPLGAVARWVGRHRSVDTVVVLAVVVGATLPYLVGWLEPGVFGFDSGLASIPVGPWLGHHPGIPWIDAAVGFVSQPVGHLAAESLLHGHLPWWNPFEGVGVPLAGNGQSAALLPLTALLALPNGQVFFHVALQLIAAVATQRLLREMGLSRWVSVVGGILFGLNGTFAWLTNAAFNPVAFLPVMLLGVERSRNKPLSEGWSGWLLVAAGLALSAYAGFPETAYLNGLLVLCWAILRWWQQPAGRRAVYAATVGSGLAVGALVAAPFLAAFRAATSHADLGAHTGGFSTFHLPAAALNILGVPYLYGPIGAFNADDKTGTLAGVWVNEGGYITAALLCAALFGLFAGRDRGLRFLLGGWVAVVLARSFISGPVADVLNLVPGIHLLAFWRYAPPSWEMAVVVLGCIGLDALGRKGAQARRDRRKLLIAGGCTLAVAVVVAVAGRSIAHGLAGAPGYAGYRLAAGVWALASVALVVGCGLLSNPRLARAGMGLVLAFDATACFMVPELSAPVGIPVNLGPVTYLQHHLGLERFVSLGPLAPNYGSGFGIAEASNHDLPLPGAWADYISSQLEPNELPQQFDGVNLLNPAGPSPLAELRAHLAAYESIGVRYVVAPTIDSGVPGKLVYRDRLVSIYRLPLAAPFYWVAAGDCTLHPLSLGAVRTDCTTPSVVVRQELDAKGWHAQVDGRSVPVRHSGPLFMSVPVPAGRSTVTFDYLPPHMELAGAALAVGVLGAVGLALVPRAVRRRRRRSGPAPPGPPPIGYYAFTTDGTPLGPAPPDRPVPPARRPPPATPETSPEVATPA